MGVFFFFFGGFSGEVGGKMEDGSSIESWRVGELEEKGGKMEVLEGRYQKEGLKG